MLKTKTPSYTHEAEPPQENSPLPSKRPTPSKRPQTHQLLATSYTAKPLYYEVKSTRDPGSHRARNKRW